MKIRYNQKKVKTGIVFSVFCFFAGIGLISGTKLYLFGMFWLCYSVLFFGYNLYKRNSVYIEIEENDRIIVHQLFKKDLMISQINSIKKILGDYQINIANKKLMIYKDNVQKEDLTIFEQYFNKLRISITEK